MRIADLTFVSNALSLSDWPAKCLASEKKTKETGSRHPRFLASVPNVTVAVGRDADIPCVVRDLANYKVAFVHLDRQMILTITNQVITRIPRFEIHHDKHHTWSLRIRNVQQEDKGHYMCQINTDPMLSLVGFVNVVGEYLVFGQRRKGLYIRVCLPAKALYRHFHKSEMEKEGGREKESYSDNCLVREKKRNCNQRRAYLVDLIVIRLLPT